MQYSFRLEKWDYHAVADFLLIQTNDMDHPFDVTCCDSRGKSSWKTSFMMGTLVDRYFGGPAIRSTETSLRAPSEYVGDGEGPRHGCEHTT